MSISYNQYTQNRLSYLKDKLQLEKNPKTRKSLLFGMAVCQQELKICEVNPKLATATSKSPYKDLAVS
jgi:hypothetical protein